jgi:Domain of unknown function (DUF4157)
MAVKSDFESTKRSRRSTGEPERARLSPATEPSHPILALQRQAGNRAVQHLLRSGAIRAKLAVSQPGDLEEQEADGVANKIMRSHGGVGSAPCTCSTGEEMCEECQQKNSGAVARKATASGASGGSRPGIDHVIGSGGHPLDASARAFFEPRFGHDFSGVRVHTDSWAAASARAIDALAYTSGNDVAFASGTYSPETAEGRKLLAHELTHVVQERERPSGITRRQLAPELSISMTPEYAKALSDFELTEQISTLENYLATLEQGNTEREQVESNLEVLHQEQQQRGAAGGDTGKDKAGEVPRPAGLPLDGAYALQAAPANLQALADILPDGELITLTEDSTSGAAQPTRITSPLAGAAQATLGSANAALRTQGFAAAGENTIFVVAIPRWGTPGATIPESTSVWGHTAVGARLDGRIVTVRGFNPASNSIGPGNYSAVLKGEGNVIAQFTDDTELLTKVGAATVEYPVERTVVEEFLHALPTPGPAGSEGLKYTAVPGNACEGSNCGSWAIDLAERFLKGRIGAKGGTPVADIPNPGQAGQGTIVRFIRNASQGAEEIAPVEGAVGPAIASGMPTALKVLKVGGRVMLVVGIAAIPVEVYLANPEERERTFAGATAGFAGGLAAGAAAGLVCGPGAPVCSVVLGLSAGYAGSVGARSLAEDAYDLAVGLKNMTPEEWVDTTTLIVGTPEQKKANCDMKEIDGVYDPLCSFP